MVFIPPADGDNNKSVSGAGLFAGSGQLELGLEEVAPSFQTRQRRLAVVASPVSIEAKSFVASFATGRLSPGTFYKGGWGEYGACRRELEAGGEADWRRRWLAIPGQPRATVYTPPSVRCTGGPGGIFGWLKI